MDILKGMRKMQRRMTLGQNVMKGRVAESNYVMSRQMQGYEVKRKAHGSDYEERKVDIWTGRRGPRTLVEVKSGNAKLSKLQRKTKRKNNRYTVVRY